MKRNHSLIAFLLVFVLALVCAGCVESKPLTLEASVQATVEAGQTVTVTVEATTGATVKMAVTLDGNAVETDGYSFVAAKKGEYAIKITATLDDQSAEKNLTVTANDLTAPVITASPADKTVEKGVYDFGADLDSIAATDNASAAEDLTKWIKSIKLGDKKTDFEEKETEYDFTEAGVYTVEFSVCDEEENEIGGSYTLTVAGIKASLAKEKYEIGETVALPQAEIIGGTGELSYTLIVKGGEEVAKTADFALYEAGTYALIVKSSGQVSDSVTIVFAVNDVTIGMSAVIDDVYENASEFVVPEITLSNRNASATLELVSINGRETVNAGDKIVLESGNYEFVVKITLDEYEKEYSYEFYCKQAGEVVGFEKSGSSYDGSDYDNAWGTPALETEAEFVRFGKQSMKFTVGSDARAGFTWYSGLRKYTTVENANAIKFWVYAKENPELDLNKTWGYARFKVIVQTGVAPTNFNKYTTTKIYKIATGEWNEIIVYLDKGACKWEDGLAALAIEQYDPTGDWTWASHMDFYIDGICAANEEKPTEETLVGFEPVGTSHDGNGEVYGTAAVNTDPNYVKTGKQSIKLNVNNNATAGFAWWNTARKYTEVENANTVKLWMYVTETTSWKQARVIFKVETGNDDTYKRVATGIVILKTNRWTEVTIPLTGSECDLKNGLTSVYFQQYDPNGAWTWASPMDFYMDDIRACYEPAAPTSETIAGFEKTAAGYDGSDYDGMWGTATVNTDAAYVKEGKQSVAFTLNNEAKAGFTWYGNLSRRTNVSGANAIKLWIYVKETTTSYGQARVKFTVQTNAASSVTTYTTDIVLLKAGEWTEVTVELGATDCDLTNGLASFCMEQYDPTGDWAWKSDMVFYFDDMRAAKI